MNRRAFLEKYLAGTIYVVFTGSKTFYEWEYFSDIGNWFRQSKTLCSQDLQKLKKMVIAEVNGGETS